VHPQDELEVDDIHVPGDPSSVAFHAAAACWCRARGSCSRTSASNWTRVGFLRIAQRMGAVSSAARGAAGRHPGEEPIAELDVRDSPLGATVVEAEEVPLAIDELPLVALLGCFAEGETIVRGAGELRLKETDRIAAVVDGLRGLGADIEAAEDGFVVRGTGGLRGGTMEALGDHRLAMLGAVAGSPRARASRSWAWRPPRSPTPASRPTSSACSARSLSTNRRCVRGGRAVDAGRRTMVKP
jgi:3-phosphoshikimate 1-carboxyvinyltransferase